jgi:hypothetical protein
VFDYFDHNAPPSQTIVNWSSWGGYFIQSLYAPKNLLVTYTDTLDDAAAQKLLALAKATHRRIYDVCLDPLQDTPFAGLPVHTDGKTYRTLCDARYFDDRFNGALHFREVMPGLSIWHVFAANP